MLTPPAAAEPLTPCRCTLDKVCERRKRFVSEILLYRCRTNQAIYDAAAPAANPPADPQPIVLSKSDAKRVEAQEAEAEPDDACVHRGEHLRAVRCEQCGAGGRHVKVYACALPGVGECVRSVFRKAGSKTPPERICRSCPDRQPPAVEAQPAEPAVVAPQPPARASKQKPAVQERLILECSLSPGDVMTLTAAVESLHRAYPDQYLTDVRTPVPDIWKENPHITAIADGTGRALKMEYPQIHESNQRTVSFLGAYTDNLAKQIGRPIPLAVNRPCLYLSKAESSEWMSQVQEHHTADAHRRATKQPAARVPFWLVNAGTKSDFTAKQWPLEYYQEVVTATAGRIQWVQIGANDAGHVHTHLRGVINLVGKTDARQLIRLAYHAQGGLGPVTFLQHLCAAWQKPYFCLLGGREPVPWVTYPAQQTFHTIGALDCCRSSACWKSRVVPLNDGADQDKSLCSQPRYSAHGPVAACMQQIRPAEVIAAILRYV